MTRARRVAALACFCFALALPSTAPAAETIGQTGAAGTCTEGQAYVQGQVAAAPGYSPADYGVITSWSAMATATPNKTLQLLVLRPHLGPGPNQFVATLKDEVRTLALASQLNTFTAGVRLPIEPAERLGLFVPAGQPAGGFGPCAFSTVQAADVMRFGGDPPLGASASFPGSNPNNRLNVSAVVEPDADRDGFGDETQDGCPGQAGPANGCPPPDTSPPETVITKGPKDKTKKKKASFEFSSNEAGATFECSLDGAAFAACTSGQSFVAKKGKHSFAVRATDAAGNVDGSPATDDWKVKRQ